LKFGYISTATEEAANNILEHHIAGNPAMAN
jgi:hypothetical protein